MEFDDLSAMLDNILKGKKEPEAIEEEVVEAVSNKETVAVPVVPDDVADDLDHIDFNELLGNSAEEFDVPPVPEPPSMPDDGPDFPDGPEFDGWEERTTDRPTVITPLDADDEDDLDSLLSAMDSDENDAQSPVQGASAAPEVIFKDAPAPADTVPMPSFTTEEIADTLDLNTFASLVTLNTRRWSGKVKDRQASKLAADAASADEQAFETHKRLLSGADEKLRAVTKAIDDARTRHYQMTLPWSTTGRTDTGKRTGGRLLPHASFKEYITEMGKHKLAMEAAAREFEAGYSDAINKARKHLGDRFDPTEYPNPAAIRAHFGLEFDFLPIPTGDMFQGLSRDMADHLSHTLNRKNRTMIENAMQETWSRAYDLVKRAAEKFSDPDALFHYTLIDSLRGAATSLRYLNVTSDPMIERVRAVIEKNLTMYDVKDIRKDEALRRRLGAIAKALLKEMNDHAQ